MSKKSKQRFTIQRYDDCDKSIQILENCDSGLCIDIDFDDVDHEVIEEKVKNLVAVLNEHWKEISK